LTTNGTAIWPKHIIDLSVLRKVRDEESRFKVWSANIAAHKTGMSSLEYRLRDASRVKSQVIRLLKDLHGLAGDFSKILLGETVPWDQLAKEELDSPEDPDDFNLDSSEEGSEIEQICDNITDIVNCLLRLSITLRHPAPHDRFARSKDTDTSAFEPFDIQHVESKFDSIRGTALAQHLGRAISRRRQYFRYREAHHSKLAHGLEVEHLDIKAQSTIASSVPEHLKDRQISGARVVADDDGSDTGMSLTSVATSLAAGETLRVPPLPSEADVGPFECPFCYMIISVGDRIAWK
jgi:hypothetical protein